MELGSDQHPDPFRDAMQDLVYRAVQVGSFAVTGTQVYAYHRRAQARIAAEQDHQARRVLNAQMRADAEGQHDPEKSHPLSEKIMLNQKAGASIDLNLKRLRSSCGTSRGCSR